MKTLNDTAQGGLSGDSDEPSLPAERAPMVGPAAGELSANGKTAEELMCEQGVAPVMDFDKFVDDVEDFWPAEESADEFIRWLRRMREGGRGRNQCLLPLSIRTLSRSISKKTRAFDGTGNISPDAG